ncbi:hypothetical protein [Variovorax sp. MHTC-1]|uniref:hypothetical protein n=1 Tax=Variovorax sp. MHTC-1 TaxID=2495593 RepID=UPI000F87BC84|nr:hypothetical protein [Variovorax sp. MHTC-1]RST51429.1 hypothetical protein EJI01_18635 [Variovorax sp. MHTC-1]
MNANDDLQDDALRRALAHAPDHAATPHWRLRKAILERAHDAVGPASAAQEPEALPWWKRLVGLGDGSRMPWNAAFATVLVATLVTVLWQREPVPGVRPDGEARVAAQAPSVSAPPAPTEPAPQPESAPVPSSEPASPVLEAPAAAAAPPVLARPEADEAESRKKETREAPAARSAAPVPAAPVAPAEPSAGAAARPAPRDSLAARTRREEEAAAKQGFAPPASPPAGPAAPGAAAGAARAARPASPNVRTEATEPPTFAALSQWNRITIAQRGGASRSLSRAEALDLNALLGSAAITAVGGQPLAATPEWRISLERNDEVLAVFEVARGQVRWREGRAPPATGAPSAPALAALNEALRTAVQAPEAAARPEAGPPPAAPR